MIAVAARPRHDADDLRRLAELGITPVHWRRSLAQPRPAARHDILVIHDGETTTALLQNLLRAMRLAGTSPRLSSGERPKSAIRAAHVVQLGRRNDMAGALGDNAPRLALPSLNDLRGNAVAKRNAWLELRTLLQQ